jgi:type VI secretion system protein ImpD
MNAPTTSAAVNLGTIAREGEAPAEPTANGSAGASPSPPALREKSWSLLDAILRNLPSTDGQAQAGHRLDSFLAEPSAARALSCWFDLAVPGRVALTSQQLAQLLSRDIAQLDALLSRQVNAILHHAKFQRLEASWRGLHYLVEQAGATSAANIQIRLLNVSWNELARDLDNAVEFDQSQLFRKVYGEEFDTAGGLPFGVLLGDYEIHNQPSADHPVDDMATLAKIAQVAAASFAPFIAAAHPTLLGLDSFTELERLPDLERMFNQLGFLKWKALRDSPDARFVALALPHVLLRLPYQDDGTRIDGFGFHEEVEAADRSQYLWGNAAYAFGAVLVRAFADHGWLANIRGVQRDPLQGVRGGGLVAGLPVQSFRTDRTGIAVKSSTDAVIIDYQEKDLGELGFLPLCHCQDTEVAAFYSSMSIQKPRRYSTAEATASARLSATLQCLLCASRFGHYLKVIGRDQIGSSTEAGELESHLRTWLLQYTTATPPDDAPASSTKAQYPLREASVSIREIRHKPGTYECVINLRPHFQLDQVVAAVELRTELAATSI